MLSQQIRSSAAGSSSLLDTIDAVRNWRAMVLLVATFGVAALVFALGGALAAGIVSSATSSVAQGTGALLGLLFGVLGIGVVFYGVNAVGMMMMDEAAGHASRPAKAAILTSLVTSHKLIVALLVVGAIYLVGALALALVLFICKVPGIGPMLYAGVFPAGVVVSGVALFAIPTVVFPLAAPAIWSGASTMAAVSQLMAVARKRLLLVLILMIVVGIVASAVGSLIGGIMFVGTWFTGILSAAILGLSEVGGLSGLGASLLGSVMGGGGIGSSAGGYVAAAMLGGGAVWASALTLPALVYLRGASAVYLRAVDGLDLAAEQEALRERLAAAQARAKEFQVQAQTTAQQYAQRPVSSPVAVAAAACPACGAALAPGDVFCVDCGSKVG